MMQPMPRVPPLDRPATYDDLVKLPDNLMAEIIDGELHASPRPAFPHADAGTAIGGLLVPPFGWGRGGPGGWWVVDEPELHLAADVLVPDWAGWRRSRMPQRPDSPFASLPPDWVCEILSPSTVQIDRSKKLGIYARAGVAHAWIIDPLAKTLEILSLEGGRWVLLGTHVGDDLVRAEPFADIELELRLLWAEPPSPPD